MESFEPQQARYYWPVYDFSATVALVRVTLFSGMPAAEIEPMAKILARSPDWGEILRGAALDAFDGPSFEYVGPAWQKDLLNMAAPNVSRSWDPIMVPPTDWALAKLDSNRDALAQGLRLALAEVLLHRGEPKRARLALQGLESKRAVAQVQDDARALGKGLAHCRFAGLQAQADAATAVLRGEEPPGGFFVSGRRERWREVLTALQALGNEKADVRSGCRDHPVAAGPRGPQSHVLLPFWPPGLLYGSEVPHSRPSASVPGAGRPLAGVKFPDRADPDPRDQWSWDAKEHERPGTDLQRPKAERRPYPVVASLP